MRIALILIVLLALFIPAPSVSAGGQADGLVIPLDTPWAPWLPWVQAPVIPDVYRDHAVERHGADAQVAREIPRRARDCRKYVCAGQGDRVLQVCSDSAQPRYVSVQWLIFTGSSWVEGTSFLMLASREDRYVRNKGCRMLS